MTIAKIDHTKELLYFGSFIRCISVSSVPSSLLTFELWGAQLLTAVPVVIRATRAPAPGPHVRPDICYHPPVNQTDTTVRGATQQRQCNSQAVLHCRTVGDFLAATAMRRACDVRNKQTAGQESFPGILRQHTRPVNIKKVHVESPHTGWRVLGW